MHRYKTTNANGKKEVLLYSSNHIAFGVMHAQATEGNHGLAVKENGRWIVKAGTVYPSNDSKALGIVSDDYDVTDGDENMSVISHGVIRIAALPQKVEQSAEQAMKGITFWPPSSSAAGSFVEAWAEKAIIQVGKTSADGEFVAKYMLNASFKSPEKTIEKNNWTLDAGTTKIEISKIESVSVNAVKFYLKVTASQTAAAGNVKVTPKLEIINNGQLPNQVTIATVQ